MVTIMSIYYSATLLSSKLSLFEHILLTIAGKFGKMHSHLALNNSGKKVV